MTRDKLLSIADSTSVVNSVLSFPIPAPTSQPIDSRLHEFNLRGADLSGVDLRNTNLSGADLRGTILNGADLRGAALAGADLRGAVLARALLSSATLSRANLQGADLSNAVLSGAILWDANLSGATLERANLWDANLSGTNLSGANLSNAILSSTDLRDANLSRAALWGTNLSGSNLSRANLAHADISNTDLSGANLWYANLSNTDFNTALVENTRFGQNKGLSEACLQDLERRGACFTNTPGDRPYSLPPRAEGKSIISQTIASDEWTALSAPATHPQLTAKGMSAFQEAIAPTPDPSGQDLPQLSFAEAEDRDEPQSMSFEFHSETDLPTGCSSANGLRTDDSFIKEMISSESACDSSEEWNMSTEIYPLVEQPSVDVSEGYVSPVSRAAAAIRNRRSKLKYQEQRKGSEFSDSLTNSGYIF